MSRGGEGCRRGPGGMGSRRAWAGGAGGGSLASGGGAGSLASSCFLNETLIHHITPSASRVTATRPTAKRTMVLRSISLSSPGSRVGGTSWRGSTMAERLLQRGIVNRQERAGLELAREDEEPEAEERHGRGDIERMDRGVI